jgi:hypothetical protein
MRQRKPQPPAPTYAVPAHTSVHGVEPLFKISDMSVVYGVSEGTIRRGLQAGTFQPVPWDNYPYRWRKSDVQKDLETRRNLRMRNHGRYGSHKLRTAKATTTSGSGNGHRKRRRG